MNEKTMRLQEEMRRESLGVEIEMNNITRKDAAKIAAKFFGTDRWEDSSERNGYALRSRPPAGGR